MRAFVVIPPTPVVTWEDADAHVHLDGDVSQKPYVESLIAAATGHIDGPDGWLGRALGVQTIEARLDHFDCGSIRLPYPPLIGIASVNYVDASGIVQTIATDAYELLGPSLVPAFGAVWPTPRWQREAVRVRYQAGYATGIPAQIKVAILMMVEAMYSGASVEDVDSAPAGALLQPLRVYA